MWFILHTCQAIYVFRAMLLLGEELWEKMLKVVGFFLLLLF